jgi:2-haloacid dehalogenase
MPKSRASRPERAIRALTFDVFGTVVDWRGSLIREGRALGRRLGLEVNWAAFADAWRAGYRPAMDRVRRGDLPWMNIDALHRLTLDQVLREFGIRTLKEADKQHLNRAWHRLQPWPDSVGGLARLKRSFIVATLSNGNMSLLIEMAKHAGLPWDCILSAELFHHYKPDPESYRGAAELLGCKRQEVMMVAAHEDDLVHARRAGLRTAFVWRPAEFGRGAHRPRPAADAFDIVVDDFVELARKLGC